MPIANVKFRIQNIKQFSSEFELELDKKLKEKKLQENVDLDQSIYKWDDPKAEKNSSDTSDSEERE